MIEYDGKNRPMIEHGTDGKPLIHNKHYIPKRFDDWLVVTVLKQEVLVGLPNLGAARKKQQQRRQENIHGKENKQ